MTRLETLKNMVSQDPNNSFVRYALATEYMSSGGLENALEEFRTLIAANPNYCAAYYHGGKALEKLGRPQEARQLYREGIEASERAGDQHTKSELQAALDLLA